MLLLDYIGEAERNEKARVFTNNDIEPVLQSLGFKFTGTKTGNTDVWESKDREPLYVDYGHGKLSAIHYNGMTFNIPDNAKVRAESTGKGKFLTIESSIEL